MNRTLLRRAAVSTAVIGLGVGLVAPTSAEARTASASDPVVLTVAYDATGSTHISKPNSNVTLGPTTLTTGLTASGSFTGTLPFPASSSSFKALGLLPVKATVNLEPVGAVTGSLISDPTTRVSATAKYNIRLSNVTVGGFPAFVGSSCRTTAPAVIPVSTPSGGSFDVTSGGKVGGTYTIGKFANCGLTTSIINLLIPGSGNTVTLTLSNGRIVG